MHQADVRPVVARKLFQPDDFAIRIVRAEKTQAARNRDGVMGGSGSVVRDSTELQLRAGLCLLRGFHGREFCRLEFGDGAAAEIATHPWRRSTGAGERAPSSRY